MIKSRLFFFVAVCLLFTGGILLAGSLSISQTHAQGPDTDDEPSGEPRECSDCHLDTLNQWQGSVHAGAYSDPLFQEAWQAADNPDCLACHTTGFEPFTGEYMHEGVTCTACHGLTPASHPDEPVVIDPGVEVCADCHEPTVQEWEDSAHGLRDIACVTCHNPHPQEIAFYSQEEGTHIAVESIDDLCLSCHEAAPDGYIHVTHLGDPAEMEEMDETAESTEADATAEPDDMADAETTDELVEQGEMANLLCSDCHWYQSIDNPEHLLTGELKPTGHDNMIGTRTCVDCHAEMTDNEVLAALADAEFMHHPEPVREAQIEISELEAELETVQTQTDNTAAMRIIQGLVAGALIGAAAVVVMSRAKKG